MNKLNFKKQLLAVAIGALAFGVTQASAAPTFTYDFDGAGPGVNTVVADDLSGTSSEYLTVAGNTFSGSGWVQFTSLNSAGAIPGTDYLNTGLYATFTLTSALAGGTVGMANSTYDVTSLLFTIWHDTGFDNSFINSDAANLIPSSISNTAGDLVLGSGTLAAVGVAGLPSPGFGILGASINTITTMALTDDGKDFFILPDPFYNLSLQAFNATGGDAVFNTNAGVLAINNATGVVDFLAVPEPGTLALFGLALVGLGGFARRRKQ